MFAAAEFADEKAYYKGQLGKVVGTAEAKPQPRATGPRGSRSTTSRKPAAAAAASASCRSTAAASTASGTPAGAGPTSSALIDGFTDYIFITIDMSDPAKPREAGRWWIPGMNQAAGETPTGRPTSRYGLHHAIVHGDTAYAAWRDAGMVVLDVADRAKPKLIAHRNGAPPFGGGTHNCLPLPDRDLLVVLDEAVLDHQEDGVKHIWMFDNRVQVQSGQHLDVPAARRGRLQEQGRPLRPAQHPREPARQLRQLGADLRHLPERRRARVRHPRPVSARTKSAPWCRPRRRA